jgi:mRNA interferase HicA
MNSNEFKRWLQRQGATFRPGSGGHLKVFLGTKSSILPMHGNSKELGRGLIERIKKQLGLK